MRLQMLLAALATTIGVAVGYFERPHWPPPAKYVSAVVFAINDQFIAVVLGNDRGETEQHGYATCRTTPDCRKPLSALSDANKVEFLVMRTSTSADSRSEGGTQL